MKLDNITRLKAVREAGYVERFHVHGRTSGYTLSQHQWGVTMICLLLWPKELSVLVTALCHDVPERFVGDIPSPILAGNPELRKTIQRQEETIAEVLDLPSEHDLPPDLFRMLKAADRLDLYLWVLEEDRRHGSREFWEVRDSLKNWFMTGEDCPPEVKALVLQIEDKGWTRLPGTLENVIKESAR